MTVSTSTWYNNAIQGLPGVGADVDIFATHTTPKYAIGSRFPRSDGSTFVYSHFGVQLNSAGFLVATDNSQSSQTDLGSQVYASGSTTAISGETIRPNTKGSHFVEFIFTGKTADQYAGAHLQTVDGDGFGYTYRVKGNTASSAKTSGANPTLYVELWEPLQQTLSTVQTSKIRIVGNRYANLESATVGADQTIAGVTTCSHAAATYGWVQESGLCGIRTEASTIALGNTVYLSLLEPGHIALKSPMLVSAVPLGYCAASGIASIANQIAAVELNLL